MADSPGLEPIKAKAYFDVAAHPEPEDMVGAESFWAVPLPDHAASTDTHLACRVDNGLVWAPFTLDDLVLVTRNDDDVWQVVELLERSERMSILIGVDVDEPENLAGIAAAETAFDAWLAAADDRGARCERFTGMNATVQLPAAVVDENSFADWFDDVFEALPDTAQSVLDGAIALDFQHLPTDPLTVDWLDTSLEQAPPDETYRGPVEDAWRPSNDPLFAAAIARARADEHILDAVADDDIIEFAEVLWHKQARIRDAIAEGRYWNVAVLTFRFLASGRGLMLPPVGTPLL